MNYCVGFIFNKNLDRVLLIKKNKGPVNMAGKLNGIGGKLEKDESGLDAMIRECKEETGIRIPYWNYFCNLVVNNKDVVYFYYTVTNEIFHYKQLEDEELYIYYVETLDELQYKTPSYKTQLRMPNLDWLIPMALNHYNKLDAAESFEIKEVY